MSQFERHFSQVLATIIAALLLWSGTTLATLSKETAVLRSDISHLVITMDRMDKRLEKLEDQ